MKGLTETEKNEKRLLSDIKKFWQAHDHNVITFLKRKTVIIDRIKKNPAFKTWVNKQIGDSFLGTSKHDDWYYYNFPKGDVNALLGTAMSYFGDAKSEKREIFHTQKDFVIIYDPMTLCDGSLYWIETFTGQGSISSIVTNEYFEDAKKDLVKFNFPV